MEEYQILYETRFKLIYVTFDIEKPYYRYIREREQKFARYACGCNLAGNKYLVKRWE